MIKKQLLFPVFLFIAVFCFAEEQPKQKIVSSVRVKGNRQTKSIVILREMLTKPGDVLNEENLKKDRNRIKNVGLFADVKVYPESLVGDSVDVVAEVKETFYWFPFPALSWSEEIGWSYGGGIAHINFRGMNQQLSFMGMWGGEKALSFVFYQPWSPGHPITYEIIIERMAYERKYEGFKETDLLLKGDWGEYLAENLKRKITLGIQQVQTDAAGKTISPENRDRFLFLEGDIKFDTRDLYENPSHGWYNSLSIEIAQGFDPIFHLITTTVDLRRYQPLFFPGHVLALQLKTVLQFGSVPAYKHQYAGGIYSIRGWDYASFIGNNLLAASLEYRIPILNYKERNLAFIRNFNYGLSGVLFADLGGVWDGPKTGFRRGEGFGLAILVPLINSLQLVYAYGKNWQLHIYCDWRF